MRAETNLNKLKGSKNYYPVPGLSTNPWSGSDVDSFLLGLYIFGKNFFQIKRFMGSKDMGEILSFYYGKFYRSDAYRRWSDSRKIKRKKCVTGRKIFTGWRQQELFSRLSSHISEESQTSLLEGCKSFADGRISLEEYVSALKSSVGIPVLVKAVAIGKGKEDLTGFAMEPGKGNHDSLVCPNLPSGQDCSSLTSKDIVKLLTGGFRLSKARCNDIFWEAVWPRLLAKGWHSEQPGDQGYISSKHYLVFLVPGIKKFSRRKLVKGEHYFDSVSDVLNKVASEPKLLELETEESSVGARNEQDSWSPEVGSDQDDPSDSRRHCYLKPRVSTSSSSHMKFTVVDTSLFCGGKSSSIRELRHLPAEFKLTSKQTNHSTGDEGDSSEDNLDEFETAEKPFHSEKAKHHNGMSDKTGPIFMKLTVVDTSRVHEGKPSKVRELRCSPVVVKRAFDMTAILRKTENFEDSSGRHEKDAADIPSKGKRKILKSNSHKDIRDSACKNQMATKKNSDTADKVETQQDQNTCIFDEKHLKTVLHQFKRRAKSGHSDFVVPVVKRRRLTACAKEKMSDLSQNCSQGLESKQVKLHGTISSSEMGKNVSEVRPHEESSIVFPAESNAEEDMHSKIMRRNSAAVHTSEGQEDKHQSEAPNDQKPPPEDLLNSRNTEMLIEEVQGSKKANTYGHRSSSKEKELVSETLKASTTANTSKQNPIVNRRQSTRNRPLTARALEALANGFLNVQRRSKSADILGGENLFSSPFRKARSKAKVAPSSHGNAVTGAVASREDKEVNGACDVKEKSD
ncbi:hypothetical protein L484_013531 [Morus notabilis]|uniref:SANT domain-containing protein n=1 Tax=Morus notabilis TaxID=981085 RepID=W9QP81_9ROSA|nr:hypothetical protein L484_013531 [Morus notabilis]